VTAGAIGADYQSAALGAGATLELESAPGYVTRCLPSPFAGVFVAEKQRLERSGASTAEIKDELEVLNIGRLRIASKGLTRHPRYGTDASAPKFVELSENERWDQGMYMIGQVAALREKTCTIADLHEQISSGATSRLDEFGSVREAEVKAPSQCAVAIVGMSSIVPGASTLDAFWRNILNLVDAVGEIPADRWNVDDYFNADKTVRDRIYSRWGGFIEDVPFDPLEFGMPPASLRSIEPFQLLALLMVRDALADAGYRTRPFNRERTSVILGAGGGVGDLGNGYLVRSNLPRLFGEKADELADRLEGVLPEWTEDSFAGLLMNVAAGRIANRFDFGGVNYTVDAACASSLAAVYLAVRDLEARTSDTVVVGGVDAIQSPFGYLCFSKTTALSPTGRSRPFDAGADGIAISEGFASLVLKRLEDAERDGDRIYGVIRGVGGSSDGRARGLTAPRPEGQMRALRRAYANAGIPPASVGLIEAHGTGTVAGDRSELTSLMQVFTESGASRQSVAVGSIKSMIGHTKATAGVAGLVKLSKALYHKVLPATIGVTTPNAMVSAENSPFYVSAATRPWLQPDSSTPRRAGVSGFGFGGTNFHVVVE
jgi:acyl transferase domain-containing protein